MPRRRSARARARRRTAEESAAPAARGGAKAPYVDSTLPEIKDADGRKMRKRGPFYVPEDEE